MAGDDAELQTAWGDLLTEKHQHADASRSYRAAVQSDRGYAPAYVGLGGSPQRAVQQPELERWRTAAVRQR